MPAINVHKRIRDTGVQMKAIAFLLFVLPGLASCVIVSDIFEGNEWCSESIHTIAPGESTPELAALCWRADTVCTFRNAIHSVNLCDVPQTLQLEKGGVYTFIHADSSWDRRGTPERRVVEVIEKDLTIVGNGATLRIGPSIANLWYFEVAPGASLNISNLTISGSLRRGCDGEGGASAIYNRGTTVIDHVEFINHYTCTFAAAVYSTWNLTVRSSAFRNNHSGRTGTGFAAMAAGRPESFDPAIQLNVSDTLFENNRSDGARQGAGIIGCFGIPCRLSRLSIIDNQSQRSIVYLGTGEGDSIGRLDINSSTIVNNSGAHSGAFEQFDGQIWVTDTTIANNTGSVASAYANDCCGSITFINSAVSIPSSVAACVSPSFSVGPSSHGMANDGSCAGLRTVPDLQLDPVTRITPGGLAIVVPKSTSPLIDAGSDCLTRDQRGNPRPQGLACDIGAIEVR